MAERVFQRGETAQGYVEVKDQDGAYADPTSIVLDLYDSTLTQKVTAQAFTKMETGKYKYNYLTVTADETGFWPAKCTVTDGSGGGAVVTIEDGGFELK